MKKKILIEQINRLREEMGAGVMACKRALEDAGGDYKKAREWLLKKGAQIAEKKAERETEKGAVVAYIHGDGRIGAMVKLVCETDFVAQTGEFKKLAYELAMQVAAMDPRDVAELMEQEYIREPGVKVEDLIKREIGKIKENIKLESFYRMEV